MNTENHSDNVRVYKISSSIAITPQMKLKLTHIAKSKGISLSALICLIISESRYYKAE